MNPDWRGAEMQVMRLVMITLGLAFCGVLGLALVTHIAA
jgi:hypothetical protein